MNPILDTPRFVFSDAASASDIPAANLKSWLARGYARLGPHDLRGGGSGTRRLMTLRTVYAFAVGGELVELGFSPSRAFHAAWTFVTPGDVDPFDRDPQRNPDTLLFDDGHTVLAIFPETHLPLDNGPTSENLEKRSNWISVYRWAVDDTLQTVFHKMFALCSGVTLVLSNPILERVDLVLEVRR